MTQTPLKIDKPRAFPDHSQLPDEDGTFRQNFLEHPQSIILTDSIGLDLVWVHQLANIPTNNEQPRTKNN